MSETCHNCKWYQPLTPRAMISECLALPPVHVEKTNTWVRTRVFANTAACRYFERKEKR